MKGKYLPFLILPLFLFTFFLVSPLDVKGTTIRPDEEVEVEEGWKDSSSCVVNSCGTTKGTKTQTYYQLVCEKTCPTVEFSASEDYLVSEGYYETCPDGYEELESGNQCVMKETRYAFKVWVQTGRHSWSGEWVCPENDDSAYSVERYFWFHGRRYEKPCSKEFVIDTIDKVYIDPVYDTKTYGPISVKYLLDLQSGVCARPSVNDVILGCKDSWAKEYYNTQMSLIMDVVDTDICELVATNTRTVDCEAELIACPVEDTPDTLGLQTKNEPVKEVGVVLAETGSTSNILVYVIQAILMLSTLASGVIYVKKYII